MNINVISYTSRNDLIKKIKKGFFNVVIGGNSDINKQILDTKNVNLLIDPESLENDFMNYKNSGLNHVLVKLAKKNNVNLGISLNRLDKLNKVKRAYLFGKIIQNVILYNKYKVDFFMVNFINSENEKNIGDLVSFGLSLGAKNVRIIQGEIN